MHPIFEIFESAFAVAIEFAIGIIMGAVLAHPRVGILSNPIVLKTLSRSLIFFFLPIYIVRSFATSTNFEAIYKMFMLPVVSVVASLFQLLLGEILFPFWTYKKNKEVYRRVCAMAIIFNTVTFIPIVFVSSLVEKSGVFPDAHGAESAVIYISLYAIFPRVFFYSFGMFYIATAKKDKTDGVATETIAQPIWKKGFQFLKNCFSPPVIGIIAGMLIAMVPPVQEFFFTSPPELLKGLPQIMLKIGVCVKSLPMIVVGARMGSLLYEKWDSVMFKDGGVNVKWYQKFLKKVVGMVKLKYVSCWDIFKICLAKLIITPLIMLFFLWILSYFGGFFFPDDDQRPLQYFVILVQSTTPLLIAVPVVLSVHDVGVKLCSEILIIQYLISPITMTIFSIFGIYFICSFEKCNFHS